MKPAGTRLLTRQDLDTTSPNHPVRIEHRGGHTSYVNSLGFKLAGVSEQTPDPAGGRFDRDPQTHQLSGRVSENANAVFEKLIPSNYTRDDYRQAVKIISGMLAGPGIGGL